MRHNNFYEFTRLPAHVKKHYNLNHDADLSSDDTIRHAKQALG